MIASQLSVVFAGAVLAGTASASADILAGPFFNSANQHLYYLLSNNTWTGSEAEAISLRGHLAVINDPGENQFVFQTFSNYGGQQRRIWIGLVAPAPTGPFSWVNGDPLSYTNWAGGEPSNTGGELYGHLWWTDGRWNNVGNITFANGVASFGVVEVACYPNCDGSTVPPELNVNDFICFNNEYAQGHPYANCDGSTAAPILNVNDFICFMNKYAAGCP